MTIVKGLKNINALVDKPKYEGTGSKVRWLKLADGQSVKDLPLQWNVRYNELHRLLQ